MKILLLFFLLLFMSCKKDIERTDTIYWNDTTLKCFDAKDIDFEECFVIINTNQEFIGASNNVFLRKLCSFCKEDLLQTDTTSTPIRPCFDYVPSDSAGTFTPPCILWISPDECPITLLFFRKKEIKP